MAEMDEVRMVRVTRRQMEALGRMVSIGERASSVYDVYGGVTPADEMPYVEQFEGAWQDARNSARLEDPEPIYA